MHTHTLVPLLQHLAQGTSMGVLTAYKIPEGEETMETVAMATMVYRVWG